MQKKYLITILTIASLLPTILFARNCRSFVATSNLQDTNINEWEIFAKKSSSEMICRAEKKTPQYQITILYSPVSKYRGKKWYAGFTFKQHQLPGNAEEAPSFIKVHEGLNSGLEGKFIRVGHSKGGKRILEYVRAEFLTDDISPLENDGQWIIVSQTKPPLKMTIKEPGNSVIKAIKKCMQNATENRNSKEFWADAVDECNRH